MQVKSDLGGIQAAYGFIQLEKIPSVKVQGFSGEKFLSERMSGSV